MKNRMLSLGLMALLGACAVTTADIEDAAKQAAVEDQASRLRLAIGEFWTEFLSEKDTYDYGTVSPAGEYASIQSQVESFESKAVAVSKVVAKTFVAPANKNGFILERVRRDTEETETDNNSSFTQKLDAVDERSSMILFEADNWVRQMVEDGGDYDASLGEALFPLSPRVKAFYTSDDGSVWKGELAETASGLGAVKLTRVFPEEEHSIASFFAACFRATAGSVGGTSNYVYQTDCNGTYVTGGTATFTVERSESLWVGNQRILKRTFRHDRILIDEINCIDGGTTSAALTSGLTDCGGKVSLGRSGPSRIVSEASMEVTKLGVAADKQALPEITDAE
jgi:hypothetical protein